MLDTLTSAPWSGAPKDESFGHVPDWAIEPAPQTRCPAVIDSNVFNFFTKHQSHKIFLQPAHTQ